MMKKRTVLTCLFWPALALLITAMWLFIIMQQTRINRRIPHFLGDVRELSQFQQELADDAAVRDLVVAERMYRVTHRNAELAALYAPDAQIHTSWQRGGVSSFVGHGTVEGGAARPNVNRCNPPLVHRVGNRAFVEYPSTTVRSVDVNGKEAILTSWMRLLYRAEKRDGRWLITAMTSLNEWDSLAPAIAGDDLALDREKLAQLRQSYRHLAYVRLLAGGEISHDELGVDRPEEVARFYEQEMAWLHEAQ